MAETKRTILERLDQTTGQILARLETVSIGVAMANTQLTNLTQQLDVATNLIADRIGALTTSLEGVATPEQLAELGAIRDRLTVLGQDPNNPIPA
jgi:hypothetical protein